MNFETPTPPGPHSVWNAQSVSGNGSFTHLGKVGGPQGFPLNVSVLDVQVPLHLKLPLLRHVVSLLLLEGLLPLALYLHLDSCLQPLMWYGGIVL